MDRTIGGRRTGSATSWYDAATIKAAQLPGSVAFDTSFNTCVANRPDGRITAK